MAISLLSLYKTLSGKHSGTASKHDHWLIYSLFSLVTVQSFNIYMIFVLQHIPCTSFISLIYYCLSFFYLFVLLCLSIYHTSFIVEFNFNCLGVRYLEF